MIASATPAPLSSSAVVGTGLMASYSAVPPHDVHRKFLGYAPCQQAGTATSGRAAQRGGHEVGGRVLAVVGNGVQFDVCARDERQIVIRQSGGTRGEDRLLRRREMGNDEYMTSLHGCLLFRMLHYYSWHG